MTWSYQKTLLPRRDQKSYGACLMFHTVMGKTNRTAHISKDGGRQNRNWFMTVVCKTSLFSVSVAFLEEKMEIAGVKMAPPEIKMPRPGQSRGTERNSGIRLETMETILGSDISLVITGLRIVSHSFIFCLYLGTRECTKLQVSQFFWVSERNHLRCLSLASQEGVI